MTLKEIHAFNKSPWKPGNYDDYDDMDFTDIGDNEAHPIARLHIQIGALANNPHQH